MFLDANVLVSAALRPDSALAGLWTLEGLRLLGSPYVVAEAQRNVRGEAIVRLESFHAEVLVLPSEPANFDIENDPHLPPKDRPVLLAAIVSGADYLLTGDITHFGPCLGRTIHGVRIMLPGEYLRDRR